MNLTNGPSSRSPEQMFTIEPCVAPAVAYADVCHVLLEENDEQNEAVVDGVEVDDLEDAMASSRLRELQGE